MLRAAAHLLLIAMSLSACVDTDSPPEISAAATDTMDETDVLPSQLAENEDPQVILGLGYRPDAFFENQLDVYLPASNGETIYPAVLLLHGGGEDKHNMEGVAAQFSERGYAAVAANLRSMGGGEYPGTVKDAFCALAWVVNAATEYGLDTSEYYVVGFSLGGTLAAMLGAVDEPEIYLDDCPNSLPSDFQLRGVVVFTGIFEYASAAQANQAMQAYVEGYLGAAMDESPELWFEASAINWVDGGEPSFLLLHGEADENIDPSQTHRFATRLQQPA